MVLARRAALLLLLLVGVSAAWIVASMDDPLPDHSVPTENVETIAAAPGEGVAREKPRRERRRVDAAAERDRVVAADAEPGAATETESPGGGETSVAEGVITSAELSELVAKYLDELRLVEADPSIHAVIARDVTTGAAREVASGSAVPMALARYVQRGAALVDGAVELVGERRPRLEEGDPIALSGRILAADDGSPVVGASVVVSSTFYVRATFYDHHLREVARTVTDAEGRWSVERLNADPAHFGRGGKAYVTVTANGFAPALGVPVSDLSPGVENRLQDVTLVRAEQTVRGRIVDLAEGKPVAGARVYATGSIDPVVYPKDQRDALFVGAPTTVTDDDGRFVLEGLGVGPQMISVHGGDDCVGRASVRLPVTDEVTIRTRAIGGRIEGEILDASGVPIPLVMVNGGGNSTHSFADGRFVLENFRGESVTLTCSHPEFGDVRVEGVADGATGVVVRMERLRPTVTLDVRHADHEAPLTHVVVTFGYPEGVTPGATTSPHHMSETGRHVVRLPDGAAWLTVAAEGFEPRTLDVVPGMAGDTVVVTLPPSTEE